jgi:death-on-curing protein
VRDATSLLFALDAIRGAVFAVDPYPSLEEKACALAHAIVASHVFVDGNHRTANEVLYLMLELNGWTLLISDDAMIAVLQAVGDRRMNLAEFVDAIRPHLRTST